MAELKLIFPANTSLGDFSLENDTEVTLQGGTFEQDTRMFLATEATTTITLPLGTRIRFNFVGITAEIVAGTPWPLNGAYRASLP